MIFYGIVHFFLERDANLGEWPCGRETIQSVVSIKTVFEHLVMYKFNIRVVGV